MMTKLVNGVRVGMTPQEIADLEASRPTPEETLERERATMVASRFQARAALHQEGLLDQVQAIMDDPGTDPVTVIAWQDAQVFKRHSPTIATIAQVMELTDEQVDDLFRTAMTIEA